jgi:hypothetical protein
MEFLKKTELFFIQLQNCLTIEPEPILQAEKGNYNLMLKPDIFFKLINDFQIEYPFIPENKIIELKGLMSKENINTKDALKIIENYKKQYWFLDTVTMFEPVINKLKRTLKSIDSNISEKEINIELINYQKHLREKRESIYLYLINEIQGLPPQPISINESRTKKVIFETFENIDKQGWQYAFVSELDYNLFTDLLTIFFEYKPYTLPETTIQLKRTCKTKVAKALGEIHKVLSNENKLSTDTEYFKIIRVLNHFKNETEGDLYKALTR